MTAAQLAAAEDRSRDWGEFSNQLPAAPVPIRADMTYAYGPEWLDIAPSRLATPDTYVELEGRTAYGDRSRINFHVTSADWQESDRLFAGVLTAFGSRTGVIPIGGYGTFDGVMVNNVRRPRIEGAFTGERMRAFDVVWGSDHRPRGHRELLRRRDQRRDQRRRFRDARRTAGSRSASRGATAAKKSTRASA